MVARYMLVTAVLVCALACCVQAAEPEHGVLLEYKRLNANFEIRLPSDKVHMIWLSSPATAVGTSVGEDDIVFGEGAYGVEFGDSEKALDTLKNVRSRDVMRLRGRYGSGETEYDYELSGGRRLVVCARGGRVFIIMVSDKFGTREGITQDSTRADVIRAYGKPDRTTRLMVVRQATIPKWISWLLSVVTGALIGFILTRMIRADTKVLDRVLYGLVVGAAVSVAVTCLEYAVRSGFSILSLMGRSLTLFSIVGGLGGGVFALLRPFTTSLVRTMPVIVAVWAAQVLASYGAFVLLFGFPSARTLMGIALPSALSGLGICLFGRQATTRPRAVETPAASDA